MSKRWLVLLCAIWILAVAAGVWAMLDYELTPAKSLAAKEQWPRDSRLVRDSKRPTLLMFLHPRCPCSRASVAELERIATDCNDRAAIEIVFVKPAGFAESCEQSPLYTAAQRITGATLSCDIDGSEAQRFGATTSGEVLLYSSEGGLLFQGGVTSSRGHEGSNLGRNTLTAWIETGTGERGAVPVYGCRLLNPCRLQKKAQDACCL